MRIAREEASGIDRSNLFHIDQNDFLINNMNCYFASALNMRMNNVGKRQIGLNELNELEREGVRLGLLSKSGLGTLPSGLRAVTTLLKCRSERVRFGSYKMKSLLAKGYLLNVSIHSTTQWKKDWRDGILIKGPYTESARFGHVICTFESISRNYFLNSSAGNPVREFTDYKIKGLFKTWNDCGIILP